MAKIPTSDTLGTPGISAGIAPISISQKSHAAEAIGDLSEAVGGAVRLGVKIRDEEDDYETQKRFIDFDLQQERKLEEAKASAPADPTGFSVNYRKSYDTDAEAFFQETPERARKSVSLKLQQRGAKYENSALDFEMRGREKAHLDDLDSELLKIQNSTLSNPDPVRVRENVARSLSLISSARIPNDRKMKLMREQAQRVEETAIRARVERGDKPDDILADLRAIPEEDNGGRTGAGPSEEGINFLKRVEGFAPVAKWDVRQFSVGYGTKGLKGQKITEAEADERLRAEAAEVGVWLNENITAPLTDTQRDGLISFGFNLGTDDLDKLRDDINAQNWDRVAQRMRTFTRADGVVLRGLVDRRDQEAAMVQHGAGMAPMSEVQVADLGPVSDAADEKREPIYRYLSPAQRMTLINVVRERGRSEVIAGLSDDIAKLRRDGSTGAGEDGRTSLDRARPFLTPNQMERVTRLWNEAKFEHEAISPLKDLPDNGSAFNEHAERVRPKDGPEYAERDKAFRKMQLEWNKIRVMRKKDPALAMADSGEVQEAVKAIRAGKEAGSITGPEAYGLMFEARLAAQGAREVPTFDQRILTKSEGAKLLDMGDPRNVPNNKVLKELYDKAFQRAIEKYGPKYASRAFEDAIAMGGGNVDTKRMAMAAARRLKAGQPLPAKDEAKLQAMDAADNSAKMVAEPDPPPAEPMPDMSAFDTKEDEKAARASGGEPSPKVIERFKQEEPSPERDAMFDSRYGKDAAKRYLYKVEEPGKPGEKKKQGSE